MFSAIASAALDLLYPPRCQICQSFGPEPLCPSCSGQVEFLSAPWCLRCGEPLPTSRAGDFCRRCRPSRAGGKYAFDICRSVAHYDGVMREAIHGLKYHGRLRLVAPLAQMLVDTLRAEDNLNATSIDGIVPVPLHRRRRWDRGFNQSELIGKAVSRGLEIPLLPEALLRPHPTSDQVGLKRHQREENVHGAFAVAKPEKISGKTILVIDDVFTTGATLNECARVLRQAGAARIVAATLARQVRKELQAR